jgi:SRSO17 transposase
MKKTNLTFFKKLFVALLVILSFTNCKVSWVPAYNENLDNQIVNAQKMTVKFYSDMMNDDVNNRVFDKYKQGYSNIATEINSIKFQLSATKNAGVIDSSVIILKNKWQQYQDEQKKKNILNDEEIETYMDYMNGFWKPVLVELRALKMVKQ